MILDKIGKHHFAKIAKKSFGAWLEENKFTEAFQNADVAEKRNTFLFYKHGFSGTGREKDVDKNIANQEAEDNDNSIVFQCSHFKTEDWAAMDEGMRYHLQQKIKFQQDCDKVWASIKAKGFYDYNKQ